MTRRRGRTLGPAATCTRCGHKAEHASTSGLCYGCYLDGLLPTDYEPRERYVYDTATGLRRATVRPPTGLPVLDAPSPRPSRAR